jgi:RNA polymerase sigma-70 factor (ECF subfamily)
VTSKDTDTLPSPGERVVEALVRDLDVGFVELFNTYRNVVFSTALRICGRWADAEDLTAEAFLRAYRALADYDKERISELRPRPWLLTIVLNLWRNCQRAAARAPASAPLDASPEPVDPAAGVEEQVERSEAERALCAMLARLPEDQRIAIVLRHVVDLPVLEIAEVLGRKEGTVKSHISRGLARLRELTAAFPSTHSDSGGVR